MESLEARLAILEQAMSDLADASIANSKAIENAGLALDGLEFRLKKLEMIQELGKVHAADYHRLIEEEFARLASEIDRVRNARGLSSLAPSDN